jgi:ATP-dependent helicase IRC3
VVRQYDIFFFSIDVANSVVQVIFTQLIDRVLPHTPTAHRTLILAHRQELVEQAARHCSNAYPTKCVEIEMGKLHASGSADITIASVQSISSASRIQKFDPSKFKLVLVDEAHHIVAPAYLRTLNYFGLSTPNPSSPALVGVSATMSRFDGVKLGVAIDQIVYHKDYIDMIGDKWLSDVSFTTVRSNADVSGIKKGANGDFSPTELSEAVNIDGVNEVTVRSWRAKASGRKSTLVFCVDVKHVQDLTNKFREHGVDARFVTGHTNKTQRSACLKSFRNGEFPVLVNCGVFTEGTDIPNIDCVLLARPTRSRNLLVQMIGRGMRLNPGKVDCHIIDMVASLETGIVTTPTLFGLDPEEMLEKHTVEDMEKLKREKAAEKSAVEDELEKQRQLKMEKDNLDRQKFDEKIAERDEGLREEALWAKREEELLAATSGSRVTFTHYDSVFDLIEDSSGEQHIRALSRNAWVSVGSGRYILANATGTYLKIQKPENCNHFIITETVQLDRVPSRGARSPFMKPRQVANAPTFQDAVHAGDTYANKRYAHNFIARNQPWRSKQATEGQLTFLNKLRPKDDQLTASSITKGKAGDMITKIKHGARGQFISHAADQRKLGKVKLKLEQEQELKAREKVIVGPMMH